MTAGMTGRNPATRATTTWMAIITAVMASRPHRPAAIGSDRRRRAGALGGECTSHDHAWPSHHRYVAWCHGSAYHPGGGADGGAKVMPGGG